MKRSLYLLLVVALSVLMTAHDAFARGGRGGGGRGGGGFRGGGGVSRPSAGRPSYSRPSAGRPSYSRPSAGRPSYGRAPAAPRRPSAGRVPSTGRGTRPGSTYRRPTQSQLGGFLALPSDAGMGAARGRVTGGVVEGPRDGKAGRVTVTTPRGTVSKGAVQGPRGTTATRVRAAGTRRAAAVIRGPNGTVAGAYRAFTAGWWAAHPRAAARAHWRYHHRFNRPWAWASWGFITGWVAGSPWSEPYYYDYGSTVVYRDNNVYYDGQPVATSAEYYQQASEIAAEGQAAQIGEEEWLPLGVFALTKPEQTQANMILQLVVNQEGIIQGTYYDLLSQGTLPVRGAVDQQTQRAAWTLGDNQTTVMETGIFNLTEEETVVLVHFGQDLTEQWLMVRLEQPPEEQTP